MLRGIDVSSVQGLVPWLEVVKEGISFALIKGVTGNDGPDPDLQRNIAGAKAAGVVCGVYLFAEPLPPKPGDPTRDPKAQAALQFQQISGFGSHPGEFVAIDAEWPATAADLEKWGCTPAEIGDWLDVYCAEVERLWGRTPLFYSFPDWIKEMLLASHPGLARYGLWMADYPAVLEQRWPTDAEAPVIPKPWTSWAFWQVGGGKGMRVAGMVVDRDVYNGTLADLQAFVGLTNPTQDMAQNAIETAATESDETAHDEPPEAA